MEADGEADHYIGRRAVAGDGVYSPDYDYLAKGAVGLIAVSFHYYYFVDALALQVEQRFSFGE